jgi:hypothetical protein
MPGRDRAARGMYVRGWVFFNIHNDNGVRGQHEHVQRMRSWIQLRWRERAASVVYVLIGVREHRHDHYGLLNLNCAMLDDRLRCWVLLRGQCGAACGVHVFCWLREHDCDGDGVRGNNGHMLFNGLRCGVCVLWRLHSTRLMHMHRRVRFDIHYDHVMRRRCQHVQRVRIWI